MNICFQNPIQKDNILFLITFMNNTTIRNYRIVCKFYTFQDS